MTPDEVASGSARVQSRTGPLAEGETLAPWWTVECAHTGCGWSAEGFQTTDLERQWKNTTKGNTMSDVGLLAKTEIWDRLSGWQIVVVLAVLIVAVAWIIVTLLKES